MTALDAPPVPPGAPNDPARCPWCAAWPDEPCAFHRLDADAVTTAELDAAQAHRETVREALRAEYDALEARADALTAAQAAAHADGWDRRDLFPLDADVTVYWPDVRPCWQEPRG